MSLLRGLKALSQSFRKQGSARTKRTRLPASRKLSLEVLEDRSLPSANFGWALAVGDTSPPATSMGYATATDAAGNIYLTGSYSSDFVPAGSSVKLTCAGGTDIFVAKYASSGVFQWAVGMGGASADESRAIAVDSAGHVDVAGGFQSTANFGAHTLTATGSGWNPFVAQLDASSGTVLWATNPFAASGDEAFAVAVDSAGNAYVAGSSGLITGGSPRVAKVDPNGNLLWHDQINAASGVKVGGYIPDPGVAVSGGNVYFSGGFAVSATFATGSGNYTVTSNNAPFAGYVLKLTSDNQFVGAQVFQPVAVKQGHSPTGWVIGIHLAADSNGNVYAYGNFYGMVNFAGSTSTTGPFVLSGDFNGNGAAYVVKLSPTLTALWAEQFGMATTLNTNGVWDTNSIAVDGSGNVYLTGLYLGATSFFGTTLTSAGSGDAFVVKLNTNGAFQWVVSAGGIGSDGGNGLAVDSLGDIDVTGFINGGSASSYTAAFDPTHSLTTSTEMAFLWQLTQP
jgi:hypothetical protein